MIWDDSFLTGVDVIDEQHKKLFDMIDKASRVDTGMDENALHDEVVNLLVKLNLYTIYHFESEEKILEVNAFDAEALEMHKNEHLRFIDYLSTLHPEPDELKSHDALSEIVNFLEKWIQNHIKKTDFNYKPFLNEKIDNDTFVEDKKREPFKFPEELEFE